MDPCPMDLAKECLLIDLRGPDELHRILNLLLTESGSDFRFRYLVGIHPKVPVAD